MSITGFVLVFILVWWIVLFMVLPMGVHVPENQEEGHAASAPSDPRLGVKFVVTSLISAAATLAIHYCFTYGILVWPRG